MINVLNISEYVKEIDLKYCFFFYRIRGMLFSIALFMRNVGVLIAYALGASVDYQYIPCICAIIPIVFIAIFTFLPNTPRYYLQKGQIQVEMIKFKILGLYKLLMLYTIMNILESQSCNQILQRLQWKFTGR